MREFKIYITPAEAATSVQNAIGLVDTVTQLRLGGETRSLQVKKNCNGCDKIDDCRLKAFFSADEPNEVIVLGKCIR